MNYDQFIAELSEAFYCSMFDFGYDNAYLPTETWECHFGFGYI